MGSARIRDVEAVDCNESTYFGCGRSEAEVDMAREDSGDDADIPQRPESKLNCEQE